MIANVVLVLFLILSIVLWSSYGLFSAFLHLLVTIVCAALSLALWEPLVLGVLIHRMPYYAWCVGLLGPFVLLLIAVRAVQDKLVRWNLRFENMTNIIGGGLCGLLSGILATGLVFTAVGLLPLGESIFGYQPITVKRDGSLEGRAGDGLLFPVDRWAIGFFESLSRGVFHPSGGTPLAQHQPRMADRAVLNRVYPVDPDSSPSVHPDSVRVDHVSRFGVVDLTEVIGDTADATVPLWVVSTVWDAAADKGTYDHDGRLRLTPSQVHLVTSAQSSIDESVALRRPEGVVLESGQSLRFNVDDSFVTTLAQGKISDKLKAKFAGRGSPLSGEVEVTIDGDTWRIADRGEVYVLKREGSRVNVYGMGAKATPFDTDRALAYIQQKSNARVVWLFRVPEDHDAQTVLFKTLRVDLPEPLGDVAQRQGDARFVRAFYASLEPESVPEPPPAASPDGTTIENPTIGPTRHGGGYGDKVETTSKLPTAVSVHHVHQHQVRENKISEGDAEVRKPRAASRKTSIKEIYTAPDEYMVRVHVGRKNAMSLFGRAKQSAAAIGFFYIEDDSGVAHHAVGYVWVKAENGAQYIRVDPIGSIRSVSQLPLPRMRQEDELYLYFAIPHNVVVHRLVVGQSSQMITGVRPPAPK